MTSQSTIGINKSQCAGRTVRDIVERNPEQVSEVWCRKIYRQLLLALERQYALQLPHRAITPDTVFFHDDGALLLLPSLVSDPVPEVGDDLTAIARIVHYAITQEVVPAAPLHGRALDGYSESLLMAVDRSLAFDPARRPRTIGELRDILGIVAFRQVPPSRKTIHAMQARPLDAMAPQALDPLTPPLPGRTRRRWVWAGAAAAVLLVVGLARFAGLHSASSAGPVVQALPAPRDLPRARPHPPAPAAVAPLSPAPETPIAGDAEPSAAGRQPDAAIAAHGAPAKSGSARKPGGSPRTVAAAAPSRHATAPSRHAARAAPPLSTPESAAASSPQMPAVAPPETAAAATVNAAGAVVALQIQPWGVVYVDGVRRGISPPIKHLALGPGRHAVRVSNPAAGERTIEVDTGKGGRRIAVDFDGAPQ